MRIGTLAYSTPTGLGYQVRSYIKHLPVAKILDVDLSRYNHVKRLNWYPEAQKTDGIPKDSDLREFLKDLDVVLLAETPLNYNLYTIAKNMGVKVANVVNWEFFDHIVYPQLPRPDLIIMPSVWHLKDAQQFGLENNIPVIQLHHPVDREEISYRNRTGTKTFHIAGKPASHDRNGTIDYLNAIPDGRVITQDEHYATELRQKYRHSDIRTSIEYDQLFNMGDILVFPRRYGGNCLPLNEALSAGIPVLMPDISPNNHLLPKEWLYPAKIINTFIPRTKVDIYGSTDIQEIVGRVQDNIQAESKKANEIADKISWQTLKPKYIEALENLCES